MKTTTNIIRTLAKATLAVTLFSIAVGFSEAQKAQPINYSVSLNSYTAVNHDELPGFRSQNHKEDLSELRYSVKPDVMVNTSPVDSESAMPVYDESTLGEEMLNAAGLVLKAYVVPEENTELLNNQFSSELESEMTAAADLYKPVMENPAVEYDSELSTTENDLIEAAQLYTPAASFEADNFSSQDEANLDSLMTKAAGLPFKPQPVE